MIAHISDSTVCNRHSLKLAVNARTSPRSCVAARWNRGGEGAGDGKTIEVHGDIISFHRNRRHVFAIGMQVSGESVAGRFAEGYRKTRCISQSDPTGEGAGLVDLDDAVHRQGGRHYEYQ